MKSLITLLSAALLCAGNSYAQTNINGQIRNDVTWTKAGSPYILSGNIEIAPEATVTVEPGTIIKLDDNLDVYGNLALTATLSDTTKLIGTSMTKKVMVSYKSNVPGSEMDLKHCYFENISLKIDDPSINMKVHDNVFIVSSVIWWRPANNKNFIFYNNMCNNVSIQLESGSSYIDDVIIRNNTFTNHSGNWVIHGSIMVNKTVEIYENTFENSIHTCLYLDATDISVHHNIFKGNRVGITHTRNMASIYNIQNNIFTENDYAVVTRLYANAGVNTIKNNSFYKNKVAIGVNYTDKGFATGGEVNTLTIENNCIYDNTEYNLAWGATNDVTITGNWWGTTDTPTIDVFTFDDKDDFKYGLVTFQSPLIQKSDSCEYTAPATTHIPNTDINNDVSVYPNPFNNTISFDIKGGSVKEVSVYNVVGRKLASVTDAIVSKITISTVNYPSGIYIYKIQHSDNTITTGKLVKQ